MNDGNGRKYKGYMQAVRHAKREEAEARNTDSPFQNRRKFARSMGFSRKSQMTPDALVLAIMRLQDDGRNLPPYSIIAIDPGKTIGLFMADPYKTKSDPFRD